MAYRFARPFAHTATAALLSSCFAASFAGCGDTDDGEQQEITLQFDAKIGSERVACGQPLANVGDNARATALKDLRFYVHDVQLTDAKGKQVKLDLTDDGVWQFKNVGMLDFEDQSGECRNGTKQTNAVLRGKAPAGNYTGVSFRLGVPSDLNHQDQGKLEGPLTGTSLYWSWTQGFIFFKLDLAMAETAADAANAFEAHVGSGECNALKGAYNCVRDNVAQVKLASFDPGRDKIVLDLGKLLGGLSVQNRPPRPPAGPMSDAPALVAGCASGATDPDCEPFFSTLGIDFASGQADPSAQIAFLAAPREAGDLGRIDPPDAGTPEGGSDVEPESDYKLKLPEGVGFSQPVIPADNPLTADKIELGRHLFYDKRLSGNQTQSCASCHKQELAFTDGRAVGLGATGESHIRGAMSLANIAYSTTLTWAQPDMKELERQARVPMFGTKPVELGLEDNGAVLLERLRAVDKYQTLFKAAYPKDADPFNVTNVLKAIASFERTLISGNSTYDKYLRTLDPSVMGESAMRGMNLFFNPDTGGSAFECFHCHGGPTFSDQLTHSKQPSGEEPFHNTGLYNLDIYGSYPMGNQGIFEFTAVPQDKGRFKAPTLRNIAVTAPYMHDGSIATLEDVLAHYARGGRNVESGPNMGDGKLNKNKSEFIHGFSGASAQDRADVIEFLKSLTDEEFLKNPAYANPWPPEAQP